MISISLKTKSLRIRKGGRAEVGGGLEGEVAEGANEGRKKIEKAETREGGLLTVMITEACL